MSPQLPSQEFEDKVFEIIQSTSFKELLNSNRIEDKKLIAEENKAYFSYLWKLAKK